MQSMSKVEVYASVGTASSTATGRPSRVHCYSGDGASADPDVSTTERPDLCGEGRVARVGGGGRGLACLASRTR